MPSHVGSIILVCVQAKIHGIARSVSTPPVACSLMMSGQSYVFTSFYIVYCYPFALVKSEQVTDLASGWP